MSRAAAWLGWLIEAIGLGTLLFAPLPLGSVFPWAAWTIVGAVAALVALSLVKMLVEGGLVLRWSPLLGPGLAMGVLLAAQLARADGSANPYATRESAALYLAYLGYLHVLGWHLVTRARIVRLLWVVAGWGTLLALLGLARAAGWDAAWLALPANAAPGRLVSTFFHPNHQALYFAMVLFLTVGLLLASGRSLRPARAPAAPHEASAAAAHRRQLASRIVLMGAMAAIGTALLLTLSRGGVASVWVTLMVTIALLWRERRGAPLLMLLLGLLGMLGLAIAGPGLDPLVGRFSHMIREPLADLRWMLWHATVGMALDSPWLGTGLGTFQDRFALSGFPLPGWHVDHAHSDYLQLWLETGLVGVGVLTWAVVATGIFVFRRRAARRDRFARDVAIGAVGAALVALLHSTVDFGLRLPGNALLLTAVGALLPAAVALRRGPAGEWVDLPTWRWAPAMPARLAGGLVVAVGLTSVALLVVPRALADWHLHQADRIIAAARLARQPLTLPEQVRVWSQLERATRLDPGQPVIAAAAGAAAVDLASRIWLYGTVVERHHRATSSAAERLAASEPYFAAAIDAYERSLRTRPQSGEVRERYGWLLAGLDSVRLVARAEGLRASHPPLAPLINTDESLVPRALREIEEAASRDPLNARRQHSLALFALLHLGPAYADVATRASRQALTLDPSLIDEIVSQLATRPDRLALLPAALPPRFDLWLQAADQLEGQEQFAAAASVRAQTLALAANPRQQVMAQLAWSRALLDRGDAEQALVHARLALVLAPDDPDVLAAMASAHHASGEWDEAEARLSAAIQAAEAIPADRDRSTRLRIRLARFLTERGQPVRALGAWREVLRATPNDAWAHYEIGGVLDAIGERTSALWEYRLAEQLGRQDVGLSVAIARTYARNGFLREASDAYRRAIALQPPETAELRGELHRIAVQMEGRPDGGGGAR